jgi:hypothetical protein
VRFIWELGRMHASHIVKHNSLPVCHRPHSASAYEDPVGTYSAHPLPPRSIEGAPRLRVLRYFGEATSVAADLPRKEHPLPPRRWAFAP